MHLLALAPFLTAAVVDALAVGHDHAGTHHHHQRRSGFSLNQVAVPGSQRHPLQDYAHAVFRHASKANSGVQTSDKEALGIGSIDNPIFDLLSGLQDLIDGNPAQDDQGEPDEGQVTTISATTAGDGSAGQPTPASFSQAARPTNATQPGPSSSPASKASASTKPSQPSQAHKEESDVTANPEQNDILYVIEAQVGDSKLTLNLDTGSADLWAYGTKAPENARAGHKTYKSSADGKPLSGASWKILYADQSHASGTVYTDKVSIGGVTAEKQAVEVADQISSGFGGKNGPDGIMGLGFSNANSVKPQQQRTFFENVKDDLPQPLFTATLKHKAPGSYDFGYIDHKKYQGPITYVPVDGSSGDWLFSVDSVASPDGPLTNSSISAIVDSGTSVILLGADTVDGYYKNVQGAKLDQRLGGYTFPCSTKLPDLVFHIAGHEAVVPGDLINYTSIKGRCFGGLQPGPGVNILGDIFFKGNFIVFENGKEGARLGFAKQT